MFNPLMNSTGQLIKTLVSNTGRLFAEWDEESATYLVYHMDATQDVSNVLAEIEEVNGCWYLSPCVPLADGHVSMVWSDGYMKGQPLELLNRLEVVNGR